MVMEIAFRCYLLNPHLGEKAATETSGVVLIDEIDLHLHPEWQKRVIRNLQDAFPRILLLIEKGLGAEEQALSLRSQLEKRLGQNHMSKKDVENKALFFEQAEQYPRYIDMLLYFMAKKK